MKKRVFGLTIALALAGLVGCGKKDEQPIDMNQTIGFDSWIETVAPPTAPAMPTIKETEKETKAPTQETKADPTITLAAELQGTLAEDSYYNPFFDLGFMFNEYWVAELGTPEAYDAWRKGNEAAFPAFTAHLENEANYLFFNVEYDPLGVSAEVQANAYIKSMVRSFEGEGYTVSQQEVVQMHIDDEVLPAAMLTAGQEGKQEMHVLAIFKEKDGFGMFIQITGYTSDSLVNVAGMLFRK